VFTLRQDLLALLDSRGLTRTLGEIDVCRDEQGRPCLTLTVPIRPVSAHDEVALSAAIARLLDAPAGSPEQRDAIDTIHAIRARADAALG
jgi:hypothetical protein